ncbi:MAG TPA: transketolase [Candidatus Limosilactobacillus merdipullorum]|uniref:Transketolase n=1 Tax=Candidatus Limosilactobacillus merdipullorum TaxID=2838653 RepID=A0A9D1QPQ2_9LACO|nr:transketolase [Candidatus Limosilactobacillus merdipullorum]
MDKMDQAGVDSLRFMSIDMIEKAMSGHPGITIDAAPMAYVLWEKFLNFNPNDPQWLNRDRFVLSAGHGSALLYSLLHFNKYDVSLDDIKNFRQLNSKTPGHPEYGHTAGVDATTGPLGQGLGMAVGMAMAEAHLAAQYNKPDYPLFDHYTYALVGDGDLMEGISQEAINIAGDKGLRKLIVLYDSNDISLDGPLSLSTDEREKTRFEAAGWDYLKVADGNNLDDISKAIAMAKTTDKPTLIEIKTIIGYNTPDAGTNKVHGSALGETNVAATRKAYHWDYRPFEYPAGVADRFGQYVAAKKDAYDQWKQLFGKYAAAYPTEYQQLTTAELDTSAVHDDYENGSSVATRVVGADVLQSLAAKNPQLWGGSADLFSSNKTNLKDDGIFAKGNYAGRNVYFGVREFGMAAAVNGINLHGGSRAYGSTFMVFSDYLKAAIRLAALQHLPSIFIFSHDSLAVGEDGPTHEPIEQLAMFRTIPNVQVFRPADAHETVAAWKVIAKTTDRPSILIESRQKLPVLPETANAAVDRGAYIVSAAKTATPDGILLATGSEVQLALAAKKQLEETGNYDLQVVSVPSMELFDRQPADYRHKVLPTNVRKRLAIEMGSTGLWYKYVGLDGKVIGVDTFGKSGKGPEVIKDFGFTVDHVVETFNQLWQDK